MSDSESPSDSSSSGAEVEVEDTLKRTAQKKAAREYKQVLRHFEDDLRHDLAVHLYSAYLLHQKTPDFPRPKWTAWPMNPAMVPDPKSKDKYTPFPNTMQTSNSESMEQRHNGSQNGNDKITRSDPDECLKIELDAMFQRKLHHRITNYTIPRYNRPGMKISLETPIEYVPTPDLISDRLKSKLNDLISSCETNTHRSVKGRAKNRLRTDYHWRDMLYNSGVKDPKFRKRVENMFVGDAKRFLKQFEKSSNSSQNLEYSEEESSDDSDEDEADAEEPGIDQESEDNSDKDFSEIESDEEKVDQEDEDEYPDKEEEEEEEEEPRPRTERDLLYDRSKALVHRTIRARQRSIQALLNDEEKNQELEPLEARKLLIKRYTRTK